MNFQVRYTSVDPQRIQHRIIRNPGYSGPSLSLNGWRQQPLRTTRKPGLQETLTEDIRDHGFRNPILVWAIPEGLYLGFGGSRLRAAHTLALAEIPCIINDYTNEFKDCEIVKESNYRKFFIDTPPFFEINQDGADMHFNLERMRREGADETGFEWLRDKDYDTSFVQREMPWAVDLIPKDTPDK